MSYESALKAAGAEVLEFKSFGSYQGQWWAYVRFEGELSWVSGSYGSCSGCDAFEGEFEYRDFEKTDYPSRLAAFGLDYLNDRMSQEEAENATPGTIEGKYNWDEDEEQHKFIRSKVESHS